MQRKILLDTNAYLRLGMVLAPLLSREIPGEDGGVLWILPGLYKELQRNPRLRHEFDWAFTPESVENRKKCRWRLRAETKNRINTTYDFAIRLSQRLDNGASPFDITCLAYGIELGAPIVTDDVEMRELAEQLDAPTMTTLQLMKRMLVGGVIPMESVRSTVRYWIAVDDMPANYRADYRSLFGEEPPATAYQCQGGQVDHRRQIPARVDSPSDGRSCGPR